MPEMIGRATILGYVPCPTCKQTCGIFKTARRRPYYQPHHLKGHRPSFRSPRRLCSRSQRPASAIDVLAILGGEA